jgi:hypothetical protein
MYCEDCKVKIDGKASVCPLCHKPVVNAHEKPAFPISNPKQRVSSRFLPIFTLISIIIMAPSIVLNVLYFKAYPWSLIVLFVLLYIAFFVRNTVMNQSHFRERLIGQTIFLTIIAFVVQLVTAKFEWILSAVIPGIYMVSIILLVTRMIKFSKYAKKNVISSYILGIMGLIPVITASACNLDIKIPSYVASGLSILLIVTVTIIFRKTIISEIKKFFHI